MNCTSETYMLHVFKLRQKKFHCSRPLNVSDVTHISSHLHI